MLFSFGDEKMLIFASRRQTLLIMKRLCGVFIVCFWLFPGLTFAQQKAVMARYAEQIASQIELVYNAPTDNERYHASETVSILFQEALEQEDSFKWKWNFGSRISVLTAPDGKFRVITWPVVRDNGEYECFGFVQSYDEEDEAYHVYVLHDKSDEIVSRNEAVLGPSEWFGAVYQELIQTSYDGRNYYTLLGWSGVDPLTQRKIIEPIWFKRGASQPNFGQALFRRERDRRRLVLEYTRDAMVNLRYETQFVREVEAKRVKKKGAKRPVIVQENHDSKRRMILFDEVAPRVPGMEGLYRYYIPTGTEMAYAFEKGKWELVDGAQGRATDSRLNKSFEPLPKSEPNYKMKNDN